MGNQGKIAKKKSGEIYVFLRISVLSFIFEKKLLLQVEKPLFSTSIFESIELSISLLIRVTEMLFLWLEWLRVDVII